MHMYTKDEIFNQALQMKTTKEVVKETNISKITSQQVIFIGCGTSYYLAIAAARYFQVKTGIPAQAFPASDLFLHPEMIISKGITYTLFSISRSGTTTEIEIALDAISGYSNVHKIAITCYGNTPIHNKSDEAIVLEHISEKSVVMTQSFTNMLYAFQCYVANAYGIDQEMVYSLDDEVQKQVEIHSVMPIEVANDLTLTQFIFLGSGSYAGIAKEATLKLKEMTQTTCESYSSLEFRHGPISIVSENTCVILLSQHASRSFEPSLVQHIQKLGGKVVAIGDDVKELHADISVSLPPSITDWDRLTLYMPYLQYLAYYRAIVLQLNPDQPNNLTQVVKI